MSVQKDFDGKIKIIFNREVGQVQFSHENIDLLDIKEVCERIAFSLRMGDLGKFHNYEFHPIVEGEESRVCIAYNHNTREIQVSVTGLDNFDACVACSYAVSYINALIFPPHSIPEWQEMYAPKG